MDIRIEPLFIKADRAYFLSIVYRSRDRDNVSKFFESQENLIKELVGLLEEG